MILSFRALFIFAIVTVGAVEIASAATTAKNSLRSETRAEKPVRSLSRLKPEATAGYMVSTDLVQETAPRDYFHRISAGVSSPLLDRKRKNELMFFGLDLAAQYSSLENQIVDDNGTSVELQDIDVYAGKNISAGQWWSADHEATFTGVTSIPLAEMSRYEGYKAILGASGSFASSFLQGKMALSHAVDIGYVWNTYMYSPLSKERNPDFSESYSVALSGKPVKGLKLAIGASVKSTHHLDGSNTISFGNSQSVSYSLDRFSFALKYANGGHVLADKVDFWFIDRHRQLVTFIASARF